MNIKKINYNELKNLLNCNYSFMVFDDLCDDYDKDINAITNFFRNTKAVSENFKFDEMYIYEDDDRKSLVIGLKQDEMKATNLPYIQLTLLMQGIKIYWLSDFVSDLDYSKNSNINEDIKI